VASPALSKDERVIKENRLLQSLTAACMGMLCLAGCDVSVALENHSSESVYILVPGEIVGFVDPLEPGQSRDAEVAAGPTLFTVVDEDGVTLATRECEVPSLESQDYLFVTWTGSEITCEFGDDPESAGGGTAGRLIPRGIFWPPAP
jgi:hypothetical protein